MLYTLIIIYHDIIFSVTKLKLMGNFWSKPVKNKLITYDNSFIWFFVILVVFIYISIFFSFTKILFYNIPYYIVPRIQRMRNSPSTVSEKWTSTVMPLTFIFFNFYYSTGVSAAISAISLNFFPFLRYFNFVPLTFFSNRFLLRFFYGSARGLFLSSVWH